MNRRLVRYYFRIASAALALSEASVILPAFFTHYNFGRIHRTLRVNPTMEPEWLITPGRWKKSYG